ncbi:nickel pincer cofactor biosynthesis protein LarB [Syntrophus aciditrophicus]|uniref:Phosphoribosylaminoimidazole carboxylase NCAIR mutase subunit n=1 Tax=Syntrophus aciditrophicus (strain SB) TaxID=56780 RepID=Q2LUY5_SYNAS|nr:nickel pincer cofactor biosynthesis protein LarB [Syntrophus aciditrophicus]ABC77893.1 phosphoribosylaminoimidazole carboxylase NCAIR mutase subunit [Syntrophus aciditrophicus SB]
MDTDVLRDILEKVKEGRVAVDEGMALLKSHFYLDVGCAKIDTHREWRVGYPEVIFCSGKTVEQVKAIVKAMLEREANILATRASEDLFEEIRKICPAAVYSSLARAFTIKRKALEVSSGYIALVTAGTSDLPVAEEAAVTAELFGNRVERIVDVGVAGIHRLFYNLEAIRGARVVIVVAGMEGALPSVVGGLVDKPVIAVPTSVGYGASFNGLSALLAMLNSCASGVCVVNIDNGYGAGYLAGMINRL